MRPYSQGGSDVKLTRMEAARSGENKYSGKPCMVCNGTDRYVVSCSCVRCTKDAVVAQRRKLREALNQAKDGA